MQRRRSIAGRIILWTGTLSGVGLLLLATGPLLAQQAVGDGRALDANQQVGSGGLNQPADPLDFRVRNDIITGNVGDGRAFRGTIDYQAAAEFQDRLGTDDLFRFRADTLSSSPDRLNAVQAGREYAFGAGPTVFRHAPATARDRLVTPVTYGTYTAFGPEVRLRDVSLGGYYEPPRIAPEEFAAPGADPFDPAAGVWRDPRGRALELTFSPLLGVRLREMPGEVSAPERRVSPPSEAEAPDTEERDIADDPDTPDDSEYRRDRMGTWLEPGAALGRQLRAPMMSGRLGALREVPATLTREQIEHLGATLFAVEEDRAGLEPGDDPYADLMLAVREDDPGRMIPPDRLVAPPADEAEAPTHGPGSWLDALSDPTDRELERAEASRREARERFEERIDGAGERSDRPLDADQVADALEALLTRLNYELPRLQSLAGRRDDAVAERMRAAEAKLVEGNYFDSERLYRQALAERPAEPLARVGLVHAQIGAGMYRSAGMHLRHLFERHPELIAARYGEGLLPGPERLRSSQEHMERILGSEERHAGNAAMLLAYLGYQAESPQLVRFGLAHAERHNPADPLPAVLRRIWLDEPAEGGNPLAEPTH